MKVQIDKALKTFKVLLIDNKYADIESIKKSITDDSFFSECSYSATFGETELMISEHGFNVIICDYNMPRENNINNGIDYLIELRKSNPNIFLCLNTGHSTILKSAKADFQNYDIFPYRKRGSDENLLLLSKIKLRLANPEQFKSKTNRFNESPITKKSEEVKVKESDLNDTSSRSLKVTPRLKNKTKTIMARIVSFNQEQVFVDCVINSESKIIEHRGFPIFLFEHLDEVTEKQPILIKIKMKSGSSKIEILPGKGIVDETLFEINEKWEQLRDSGLDEKLFE